MFLQQLRRLDHGIVIGGFMASFTDTAGRRWAIVVNYSTACRIEDESGIDVRRIFDDTSEDHAKLMRPANSFRALCAAVRDQLTDRGITDEEFGRNFDHETCDAAIVALHEAVIDFFPNPTREKIRSAFRRFIEAAGKVRDQAISESLGGEKSAADSPES